MWLLSTTRAELQWFNNAADVHGGYAILSHRWDKQEQTFQDVSAIVKRCRRLNQNPLESPNISPKIRECCLLAKRYGYDWVWIDSCCIDKTSSTELSKAINSMFKWYWQAEVCFAFLVDVSTATEDVLCAHGSEFRRSEWHQRGWTLQELIAPAVVIFFSKTWERLGTKAELAKIIENITNIPLSILMREQYYNRTSIANRMWWASKWRTTRPEDRAYSLMGLFDVSMPIIYGEGPRAFQRLQQKIMKHGFDMSLFAWGGWISSQSFVEQNIRPEPERDADPYIDSSYLFAPSPSSFEAGFHFTPQYECPRIGQEYPPSALTQEDRDHGAPFAGIRIPTATLKNYGVACEFPVFTSDGFVVAVLLCVNKDQEQIGLLLKQERGGSYDPHQPLFYTGVAFSGIDPGATDGEMNDKTPDAYRLVTLGKDIYNLRFNGKRVVAHWRTLYIQPWPEAWFSPETSIARLRLNCSKSTPFRVPHWLIAKFAWLGFQLLSEYAAESPLPLRLWLSDLPDGEHIYLDLGICNSEIEGSLPTNRSGTSRHWARVLIHHAEDLSNWRTPLDSHICGEHHIADWPERKKLFGDEHVRGVELSFEDCKLMGTNSPTRALAVGIELKGSVYEIIARQAEERRPTGSSVKLAVSAREPSWLGRLLGRGAHFFGISF